VVTPRAIAIVFEEPLQCRLAILHECLVVAVRRFFTNQPVEHLPLSGVFAGKIENVSHMDASVVIGSSVGKQVTVPSFFSWPVSPL
jgi:hypothetical protein